MRKVYLRPAKEKLTGGGATGAVRFYMGAIKKMREKKPWRNVKGNIICQCCLYFCKEKAVSLLGDKKYCPNCGNYTDGEEENGRLEENEWVIAVDVGGTMECPNVRTEQYMVIDAYSKEEAIKKYLEKYPYNSYWGPYVFLH